MELSGCPSSELYAPYMQTLAIGFETGNVHVLEVETGETMSRLSEHTSPIVHLHWQAELEGDERTNDSTSSHHVSEYADRSAIFFPPPPAPTPPPGSAAAAALYDTEGGEGSNKHGSMEWPVSVGAVSTLCTCDEDGNISLHALGSYCVGRVSLCSDLQFCPKKEGMVLDIRLSNVYVYSAVFSPNLNRLSLAVKGKVTDNSDTSEGLFCVVLDTRLFFSRREEIRRLAMQALHIKSLMVCVDSGLESISKHWDEAIKGFTSKLTALTQELERK